MRKNDFFSFFLSFHRTQNLGQEQWRERVTEDEKIIR
jgi:hypothetical protein